MNKFSVIIKGNPLAISSSVIVLLFGASLYMALDARTEREALAKQLDKPRHIVRRLRGEVMLPPLAAGESPEAVSVVVNQHLVLAGKAWKAERIAGSGRISKNVIRFNRGDHKPMLSGLFDKIDLESRMSADQKERFRSDKETTARSARFSYIASMKRFLEVDLRGGLPPSVDRIYKELSDARTEFISNKQRELTDGEIDNSPLNEVDEKECREAQRKVWHTALVKRAEALYIYANTKLPEALTRSRSAIAAQSLNTEVDDRNTQNTPYPFEFDLQSKSGEKIGMDRIWQWQEQLWIIEDIIRAIRLTNEAVTASASSTVRENPIKKLVQVRIGRGYVGLGNNTGLGSEITLVKNVKDQMSDVQLWVPRNPSLTGFGGGSLAGQGGLGGTFQQPRNFDVSSSFNDSGLINRGRNKRSDTVVGSDVKGALDYHLAHTGRKSNKTYRVKHTICTIVIEARQVPVFIDKLAKVNFNTVIAMHMGHVDLYEQLVEGYVYGSKPLVELTVVIESLWLNEWVDQYMPKVVLDKYNAELNGVEKNN